MDLQAELKWIHKELDEVKDETLLEAIKSMLKYRKKVKSAFEQESNAFYTTDSVDLQKRAELSLESIAKGETRDIDKFKKEVDNWKNQQAI